MEYFKADSKNGLCIIKINVELNGEKSIIIIHCTPHPFHAECLMHWGWGVGVFTLCVSETFFSCHGTTKAILDTPLVVSKTTRDCPTPHFSYGFFHTIYQISPQTISLVNGK